MTLAQSFLQADGGVSSVRVELGKGGQNGVSQLVQGEQEFQPNILTSLGIVMPVQIWLLPAGLGRCGEGESGVSGLVLKGRCGCGSIWLTAILETLRTHFWRKRIRQGARRKIRHIRLKPARKNGGEMCSGSIGGVLQTVWTVTPYWSPPGQIR